MAPETLRLCEWGRAALDGWSANDRAEVRRAVENWRLNNRMGMAPLSCDETGLRARQWVGVVEAAGRTIEIYPKLDAALLKTNAPDAAQVPTVMSNLLWMLDVSAERTIYEADVAALDALESFFDLFAWLLARRLLNELQSGLPHRYEVHQGDLSGVRGRINLTRQVTTLWDRRDRIACVWDEFTPDTPLLRLFKSACRFLQPRAKHPATVGLLADCLTMLDDVSEMPPFEALAQARDVRWDRATQRFRTSFDLARRLLQGSAPALGSGDEDTFVFLLDMNKVFENFVAAALEERFQTRIETQKRVGFLFPELLKHRIAQDADYFWHRDGALWIGDAKYKSLAGENALTFAALDIEDNEVRAGQVLSPDDVRQLTVYAELARLKNEGQARLALFYPFVGAGTFAARGAMAWNGCEFYLVPVRVGGFIGAPHLDDALPDF